MKGRLTVLGTSSAISTLTRNPSAQHLELNGSNILLDCGEATQMRLIRKGIKLPQIKMLLVSHLHPDHYLGIPGMLSTMSLQGRKTELIIICHSDLKKIIDVQVEFAYIHIAYPIKYIFLDSYPELTEIYQDDSITICAIDLDHRLPCCGFIVAETKKPYKIDKDKILNNTTLTKEMYDDLREGRDCKGHNFQDYTVPNSAATRYAYITDTLYLPLIAEKLKHLSIDWLYHESTYLHNLQEKAKEYHHTTAVQAGEFAKIAKVKNLLLGHFSSRYSDEDLDKMVVEAKTQFTGHVQLASEETQILI